MILFVYQQEIKIKTLLKGDFHMSEEKFRIIGNSADEYKKLPKDKQMFILGFMQGVLSNQQEKPKKKELQV